MVGNLLYDINVFMYKNNSCKLSYMEAIQLDFLGFLVKSIFKNKVGF